MVERVEGWSQKGNELKDSDNSVVIAGGGGWMEVEEGIGDNGNGKSIIKNGLLKKIKS